jgi:hypothetical protein
MSLLERGESFVRRGGQFANKVDVLAYCARMDFSKSLFSWRRPLSDYSKMRWLLSRVRRNNCFFVPKVGPGAYLNVGCGENVAQGRTYVESLDGWNPTFPSEYYRNNTRVNQPAALINELIYEPDHHFNYDDRILAEVLEQAGFVEPTKRSINKGHDEKLLIDDRAHVSESLYVEARKPIAAN